MRREDINKKEANQVEKNLLPGEGFHGGKQKETLPGGGFHGGKQQEELPGDEFH